MSFNVIFFIVNEILTEAMHALIIVNENEPITNARPIITYFLILVFCLIVNVLFFCLIVIILPISIRVIVVSVTSIAIAVDAIDHG